MLENATRICEAKFGILFFMKGARFAVAAAHDVPPVFTDVVREGPFQPAPGGVLDTAMKTRRRFTLHDLTTTTLTERRHPNGRCS